MINIPCNMVTAGLSRSGKSVNFKCLYLPICHRFRYTLLISTTNKLNCEYQPLFNTLQQHHRQYCELSKYDEDIVKDIMEKQELTIMKLNRKYGSFDNIPKETKEKLHVSIIMDDLLGQVDFHHSIMSELFAKSRHLYISIFILQQHINTLSVSMRINSHYLMITKLKDNNIDTVYDLVVTSEIGDGSKKDLRTFLSKYCVNYQCILFSELPFSEDKNGVKKHYKVLKFSLPS